MIDFNLLILLAVIALFVFAWACIETRHTKTSRGLISMFFGCALFAFGLVNFSPQDKLLLWAILVVGSFVALFGVARFVVWQIKDTG